MVHMYYLQEQDIEFNMASRGIEYRILRCGKSTSIGYYVYHFLSPLYNLYKDIEPNMVSAGIGQRAEP